MYVLKQGLDTFSVLGLSLSFLEETAKTTITQETNDEP
jgi:hypothetical protein